MEKIKVLIVEDQALIAESLAALLEKHGMHVAGVCGSGEEAIDLARSERPDLILMDIGLSGTMDGIAAATEIQKIRPVPIIYLTDHTDKRTFDRAKETLPAHYIGKPFNETDLVHAIDLAFTTVNGAKPKGHERLLKDHIFLKDRHLYVKMAYNDILYLEADRAYCDVVTAEKTYTQSNNMSHVFEQIDHPDFLRVHRSYVVNVNRIIAFDGNVIKMGDGKEVQMSHDHRDKLIGRLKFIK